MIYLIIIPILLILYIIIVNNKFITKRNKADESYSGIDVALSKRFDLITSLVQVVKGFTKHESETLQSITQLRNASKNSLQDYNQDLNQVEHKILAVAENYPQLKADTQFTNLQLALVDVEEHLQAARRLHNRNVNDYNTYIQLSPQNLLPMIRKAEQKKYFELDSESKSSPKIF